MSLFEKPGYRWRETYFVVFSSKTRPTVSQVEQVLSRLNDRFDLQNLQADDEGHFESVTLVSPEDYAALDICYVEGDEVVEQVTALAEEMKPLTAADDRPRLRRVANSDARLDILHFQDVAVGVSEEDELDEMFDPSALLVVLEALVDLTGGIAVDPQSSSMM
jgi:hypothetical protein